MDKRAVIIAGGGIYDDLALSFVQKDSYIIAADRGLVFLAEHDIVPDLIVGDFDSAPEETRRRYLASHPLPDRAGRELRRRRSGSHHEQRF